MNRFDKILGALLAALVIFAILIPAWIVGSNDMVKGAFGSVAFFMTLYLYRERDDLLTSYAEAKVESATINGKLAMAQVEARATSELATQMAHEARALENIVKAKDAEIARLREAAPHYGRDPKTGRFKRITA